MNTLKFTVSFPTDNGFWGRECNKCKKYFKVQVNPEKGEWFCPYCGELQPNSKLWTKAQNKKATEIAQAVGKRYVEDQLEKMFKNAFGNSNFIKYTPGSRTTVNTNVRHHVEKKVDTEIECPSCNTRFQIFGIFGHCPGCKEESIMIQEANLQIILQEISNSQNKERHLRHAYNDIVSTFEGYCKLVAKKNRLEIVNFQNIKNARSLFKGTDVDIYKYISENEKVFIKRIFEKRHAYQHTQGIISDNFIQNIPFDRHLLGQKAELSISELTTGIEILKKILKPITEKYGC